MTGVCSQRSGRKDSREKEDSRTVMRKVSQSDELAGLIGVIVRVRKPPQIFRIAGWSIGSSVGS